MLNLLFLKRTNRQGWFRHIVTIFAVSLSVMILLACLSIGQALNKGIDKDGIRYQVIKERLNKEEVLRSKKNDLTFLKLENWGYKNKNIEDISLYKFSKKSPNFPGLSVYPNKNQILVSKSLNDLIKKEDLLAERFKDYDIKVVDTYGISRSPDELIAIKQISEKKLNNSKFDCFDENSIKKAYEELKNYKGVKNTMIFVMMLLCGLGISFPLFMLIISSTRIGIAQREERYSALSLLGTSKRQINRISLSETFVGTFIGIVIGSGLYYLVERHFLTKVDIGFFSRFYKDDLQLPIYIIASTFILIILSVIFVNFLAIRKAKTSPLGTIKRQVVAKKPKMWRLVPIFLPIAYFGFIFYKGGNAYIEKQGVSATNNFIFICMLFFLITMIAILLINSYITYLISLVMLKFAKKGSTLMASKRLKIFAKPLSHSVNGVVLALFVGSFMLTAFASAKLTIENEFKGEVLVNQFNEKMSSPNIIQIELLSKEDKDLKPYIENLEKVIDKNSSIKEKISLTFRNKSYFDEKVGEIYIYTPDELKRRTQLKCPSGVKENQLLAVETKFQKDKMSHNIKVLDKMPDNIKEDSNTLQVLMKNKKDTREVKEMLNNISYKLSSDEEVEYKVISNKDLTQFNILIEKIGNFVNLIYLGTIATILIGGFSLGISTIGGFFERKKSFTNLRLMGIDMKVLNKTVLLESFVPMLAPSLIATALGIGFANSMLKIMDKRIMFAMPDVLYLVVVLVSFVMAFAIIFAILPILKQITELDKNRTE